MPLPPLEEQKRIVAKIEELMPFVEQYAKASTRLNTLNASFPDQMKKSILQQAVMGKLVPQDPSDEPVSVLLKKIADKGVSLAYVTLHVGLGTFRPVKEENIEDHPMHAEYCMVSPETADKVNRAHANGKRVIAVGTTSCRTLESFTGEDGILQPKSGWTDIFIYPGYRFKAIDALVTNFHLPESTLIMLVSALAGRQNVLRAYEEAVRERYRFFSFGDAMFIY